MRLQLDPRYCLLTAAYLLAIYRLSSLSGLGSTSGGALVPLLSNFSHVPLFAGLAFCVLKSLCGAREVGWARYGLALVASAACAAVDEWHQSFVPERHSSVGDFLLDLAGIGGMLLVLRLHARRKERRRAGGALRPEPPILSPIVPSAPLPATGHAAAASPLRAGPDRRLSAVGARK